MYGSMVPGCGRGVLGQLSHQSCSPERSLKYLPSHPCAAGFSAWQELGAVIRDARNVQEQIQHTVPGKRLYFSANRAQQDLAGG